MLFAPPKFDFGQLPRGDIHHRANDLDGAGYISLRFSNNVYILDPPVWHQQANLEVYSFSFGSSGYSHFHHRQILRVNALQDHLQRDFGGRVEFKNTERLVGPEVRVSGNVPPEAACVAESLGFGQTMLAAPQGFFDALAVLD